MKNLQKCPECGGKGEYVVLNAYDENLKTVVLCEYCGGGGYIPLLQHELPAWFVPAPLVDDVI